jgi:hypothetical protein
MFNIFRKKLIQLYYLHYSALEDTMFCLLPAQQRDRMVSGLTTWPSSVGEWEEMSSAFELDRRFPIDLRHASAPSAGWQ